MMENQEDKVSSGVQTSLSQLIEVEQSISHLKERLSSLKMPEPPSSSSACIFVSTINGGLNSSTGGEELDTHEASDSGVFVDKNEALKCEDSTHEQSPETSCGGETQNDSSTSQSPPTSSHTQRLSTMSLSTTSTGFESMSSSGSTNNRDHMTHSDTQFQFPCTTAKEDSTSNPDEQNDGDSEGEHSSWDSWFEDDCEQLDTSVDKSIPLASSDVNLDKKDSFPVEEDFIDNNLEQVDSLCNTETKEVEKNKTEVCVEVKKEATVTTEEQSGTDSGPSQTVTSPNPHRVNNSPLEILDSHKSPSPEETDGEAVEYSSTPHSGTINTSSPKPLVLQTPLKLSQCPVSCCNNTTQSSDVSKSLNSRAHPFSPVQSTYGPSTPKSGSPIRTLLSTPSSPLAPPKGMNLYRATPNTGYLGQSNPPESRVVQPSTHPGVGVSIASPLLMSPSPVLTTPQQVVRYASFPPQYLPVYYPNSVRYRPVHQGAPIYSPPSQQQVFHPQAPPSPYSTQYGGPQQQFLYDPRLLHHQVQQQGLSGHYHIVNGQQQATNGQYHVVNGQQQATNGQYHVVNGQQQATNGQYHVVNGQQQATKFNGQYQAMTGHPQGMSSGGVGILGPPPGYTTLPVPATPTRQQEGGANESLSISQVPTAVLQSLSTNGPLSRQTVLQKRPSAAVPIRGPPDSEPSSQISNPLPSQRCTAPGYTAEMSNQSTSAPSVAPDVAVDSDQALTHQASPLNQTSTSVVPVVEPASSTSSLFQTSSHLAASTFVGLTLPGTTQTQSTPKTKLSGVGGVSSRVSSPIGLGRGKASERSETPYAKRSARSIGLGRGLSPGVPRARRPGGMNTNNTRSLH